MTLDELQAIRGVGQIKAIELKATVELGARIQRAAQPKYGRVHSSVDIANQMMEELKDYQQEHLLCLYLNTKNEIIQKRRYSSAVSISRLLILEKFITEQFVAVPPE